MRPLRPADEVVAEMLAAGDSVSATRMKAEARAAIIEADRAAVLEAAIEIVETAFTAAGAINKLRALAQPKEKADE